MEKENKNAKRTEKIWTLGAVIVSITLAVLFFVGEAQKEKAKKEKIKNNAETVTVSCTVDEKYYQTDGFSGRATPMFIISFYLEADGRRHILYEHPTQEVFDKVFIGDNLMYEVTYYIDEGTDWSNLQYYDELVKIIDYQMLETEIQEE